MQKKTDIIRLFYQNSTAIKQLKEDKAERYIIKQMEKSRVALEEKDDVVTYEQLGVDRLNVDEAYKNLFMFTKMQNVAGITSSAALQ